MRDYRNFESYVNKLSNSIYEQPPDEGHTKWATEVINNWVTQMPTASTVLDLGCGQGFCKPLFEALGKQWTGVTLGPDYLVCKDKGYDVYNYDFSFLEEIADDSYDLLFSRHSLEHSPFPLLTLMEWYRVSKQWLCLILPNPVFWTVTGRNHYSVMYPDQVHN